MPLLTYGVQLWWNPTWNKIRWTLSLLSKAQNRAVRWITGAFRTSPSKTLEVIAGIIPIDLQINKYMKCNALQVRALPLSHPTHAHLSKRWPVDKRNITAPYPMILELKNTITPMTHIDKYGRTADEDFTPLHCENRPGDRLLDQYPQQIIFALDAPKKSSDNNDFTKWLEEQFMPTLDDRLHSDEELVIFTDGSVQRSEKISEYKSAAAYIISRADNTLTKRIIETKRAPGGAQTSFDAEMMALAMSLKEALKYMENLPDGGNSIKHIHIYVDNKSAVMKILDPSIHTGQSDSIRAITQIRKFLESAAHSELTINWCPSHVGIKLNELVDKEAKKGLEDKQPDFISWSVARERAVAYMLSTWRKRITSTDGLGTKSFLYPRKYLNKATHIAKRHEPLKQFGQSNIKMARFTWTITGHAPIGEF